MSLEQSIKLAVESLGAKLYDIVNAKEHDRNIFRVLVTAEKGISLDKCAEISRMISPILDIDEPMNGEYVLEIRIILKVLLVKKLRLKTLKQ